MTASSFNHPEFGEVIKVFLGAVRGSRSQEALSHELESNFNIVNRWESGSRGFYWNDFLQLALLHKWDLSAALKEVTHFSFSENPPAHEVLGKLLVPSSQELLLKHFSRQKLNRLAAGKSKLLFAEFLLMIQVIFGRTERFLAHFIDANQAPFLRALFQNENQYRTVVARDSLTSLISMVMELESYQALPQHSDAFLAQMLEAPEAQVAERVRLLEKLGMIIKTDGPYAHVPGYVDTGASNRAHSRMISNHWRQQILDYAQEDFENQRPNLMSSNILYASNAQLEEKIFEVCRKFYIDIKNLVAAAESSPKDRVRFIGIDLFYPLDPPKDD